MTAYSLLHRRCSSRRFPSPPLLPRSLRMSRRVLMILTSNARMGDTGKATGLWAEELAVPYYRFTDAGVQVDLASPLGGPAPIDAGSLKPRGQNEPMVERLLADEAVQALMNKTAK